MVVVKKGQANADLPQIGLASGTICRFPDHLDGGTGQRNQEAGHRDDYHGFDQCDAEPAVERSGLAHVITTGRE